MLLQRLNVLADQVGELGGQLRLLADDASPVLARALTDAADLLDRADEHLARVGIAAAGRRQDRAARQRVAEAMEAVQGRLFPE